MGNLLRLIIKYHLILMLLALEGISFYMIISNNSARNSIFLTSANTVTGYFYKHFNFFKEYLSLRGDNEKLAEENSQYLSSFEKAYKSNIVTRQEIVDSLYRQQYTYISARVINNSVNKQFNYLTIDKGLRAGVRPDMAVVTSGGIVGVVRSASENFASVISVLNRKVGVSAKIKKNGFFGSIVWDGVDYRTVSLKEIPSHISLNKGDTVITSGFSALFPEGIPVGIISGFKHEQAGNFYDISVKLTTDFKSVSYVYVVSNFLRKEQDKLEKTADNE